VAGTSAAHPTTSPAPGSDLALVGSTTVSVQDATTGLFYDGAAFSSASRVALSATPAGGQSWTLTLMSGQLTSGHTYSVDAMATDSGGNVGTSPAVTFGYLTTAPAAAITSPVTATTYGANWSQAFGGTASAFGALLVGTVELSYEDTTATPVWWTGSTWSASQTWVTATGTTSWTYPVTQSPTQGHTYRLTARVTDTADNVTTTPALTWTYDTSSPTATVTYPVTMVTYGANWGGALTGSASATAAGASVPAGSTVVAVQDTTSGLWWNGASFSASSQTWVPTGGSAGSPTAAWSLALAADKLSSDHMYEVSAKSTDSAGNVGSASPPVPFQFDLGTPTAEITYPTGGLTYGTTWAGFVQGTASTDPTSGATVESATFTIQDTTAGTWWNGSSWVGALANVVATPPAGLHAWTGTYPFAASSQTTGHTYTVSAVVTDTAHNSISTGPTMWHYNTAGSNAAIGYPVSGSVYGANWGTAISGTAAAGSGISVTGVVLTVMDTTSHQYWNGTGWQGGATTVPASGTTSWSYSFSLSHQTNNHAYSVVATAADSAGNTPTPSTTATWTVDTSLPTVSVGYPANSTRYGPNWTGAITGTSSDTAGNLSVVRVQVQDGTSGQWWNGTTWQGTSVWVTATGTDSWSYPLALAKFSDNHAYTVIAAATDTVGNVGTSSTVGFTMDIAGALPVAITYPVSTGVYGANWSGTLAGTSGDPSGDLSSVALTIKDTTANQYWNGSTSQWQSGATTVTATNPSTWSYDLAASRLTTGHSYAVTALVSDAVGNTGTTTSAFSYVTGGGSTATTYPANATTYGANWNGAITGTAAAPSPQTVTRVNVSVKNTTASSWWNGLNWQGTPTSVIATGTTTWSVPLGAIQMTSGGSYTVDATAIDNLANSTVATQIAFTFRSTAPAVAVTYPTATTYGANWSDTISGTAAAGSGLSLSGASTLAVKDATTGRWFTGSAFSATSQTWLTATGSTAWSYALASTYLTSGHSYTVVGRAIDNAGNTTVTGTISYGFDTTAPTAAVSSPVNGAAYGATWSGVLAGSASAHAGLNVARVDLTLKDTTAGTWWNGSVWQGGTTTVAATGTGTWNYSLAGSLTSQHAYSLSARSTDTAGNIATSTGVAWTYDTRGPGATISVPSNNTTYGPDWTDVISGTSVATATGSSILSGATAISVASTTQGMWFDGTAFASPTQTWLTTTGSTSWTYALASEQLVSGEAYSVLARTTDSLGNQTTTAVAAFDYDLTLPSGIVTSPSDSVTYGVNWGGTLAGTAAGGGSLGVTAVALSVQDITGTPQWWNGSSWQATATTVAATLGSPGATTSTWSYAVPSARLTTGHTYTATATVTNQVTSAADSDPVSWGYNLAAPSVAVAYPVTSTVYGSGWSGSLGGTSSADTGLAVAAVVLTVRDTTANQYWNGTAWQSGATTVPASGTATWAYALALGSLTNAHAYSVTATATDSGGNGASSSAATWTMDTTPPITSVSTPIGGMVYGPNWTGTLSGTATDTGGSLTQVRVQVRDTTAGQWWNGTGWQGGSTWVTATGLTSWTSPLSVARLTDTHTYSVIAAAVDAAGNTGTSATATFVADLDGPLPVSTTYPLNNSVYGANWSGTITGTAGDASGNLSSVGLTVRDTTAGTYWNGSSWQGGSTIVTPVGTATWSYGLTAARLTTGHGYSVTATATDAVGNSGTSTSAFSYQTSGVTTAITYPVASTSYGANWTGSITGTAAAASGRTLVRVDVTLRNTTANTWWNGVAWQGTSTSVQVTGTSTWSYALAGANLTDTNSYTVAATATDDLSNTTSAAAVAFTYRATAPSVVITYPVATTYGAGWSGTVAGTASAAPGLSLSGNTAISVQDTTTGKWFTGSAFTATTETWLTGTGSTSWTYALAASNLTSGDSYTVTARAVDTGGNTTTTSATAFTYFVATKVVVLTQPTTTFANAAITPPVSVAIEDAAGHIATTDSGTQITLAFGANPGGATLNGGGTATVVGGVATYSGLSVTKAGTGYTLVASSSGLTSATSSAFNVGIGAATKVMFTRQPSSSATSGTTFATQPLVAITDAYGNTVTSSSASVSLTASGGTFTCTARTVTASAGVATFAGCKITGTGSYTLTAASSALTSATSNGIAITSTQVGAPYNVAAVSYGSTAGRTRVTFTRPSPTTGISSYTCAVYSNIALNQGALITSRSCQYSGTTITVGSTYTGTNTIIVIVTANPSTGYSANSSAPTTGSVR
jgi:hypothetical protein